MPEQAGAVVVDIYPVGLLMDWKRRHGRSWRYAVLWTHNLLSNPSLADLAERKRHEREGHGRG